MSFGIQCWDSQGRLTFHSDLAVGGVCLGIFNLTWPDMVFTFPDMGPGLQGFAMNAAGQPTYYSYDNNLGYPRFTFPISGTYVALFVK